MMPLGQYELGSYVKGLLEDIDYIDIDSKTELPFKKEIQNDKKKKEKVSINLDEVIKNHSTRINNYVKEKNIELISFNN